MLKRARASVTAQTFRDFVWIVVNDGGTPAPVEAEIAAAREAGLNATLVNSDTPASMERASNLGVRASRSRYVAIHDDDDSWEPNFLKIMVNALERESRFVGAVSHTATVTETVEGDRILYLDRRPQNRWLRAVHLADLAIGNLFPPISFLYRRERFDAVAGYDESFPVLGDWDFNLKMALSGDILVVPEMLANYHVRIGNKPPTAAYANSVTSQQDLHRLQDALFRNRVLRTDMAANRIGIGWMLMFARLQHQARRTPHITPRWTRSVVHRTLASIGRLFSRFAVQPDKELRP